MADVYLPEIPDEVKDIFHGKYNFAPQGRGGTTALIDEQIYVVCEQKNASGTTDLIFKKPEELQSLADALGEKLSDGSSSVSPTATGDENLFGALNRMIRSAGHAIGEEGVPTYNDKNPEGIIDQRVKTAIEKMLNSEALPAPSVPAPAPGNAPAP